MRISLSEVINRKSDCRDIEAKLESAEFLYMGNTYPITSASAVKLTLFSPGPQTVVLKGNASLIITAPCDRCLDPVELPFDLRFDYRYVMAEDGTAAIEDDETVNYINGYELDVDGLVNEEVLIGFPMKVLCKEECKGICTGCGANLNRGECGCDRTVLDPRMSIIRDLFRQKEV